MKKAIYSLLMLFPYFCSAQQGNEIYLFDMKVQKNKIILSNPQNITQHRGYDNQPFFHPSKPIIYYTSEIDTTNTDIKYYNYKTKETKRFTITKNLREYSPTVMPNGKYISCIIQRENGKQDLGKYLIDNASDSAIELINNLKVGYHTWIDQSNLLLFVLGDSSNDLHLYNSVSKKDTILARKVGRALHKIPQQEAMSFIDKSNDSNWFVKRYDIVAKSITTIIPTLKNSEDLTWLKDGTMLMSDGQKIYLCHPNGNYIWKQLTINDDTSILEKTTRLAVNKQNNKIAVVVSE